MSMNGTKKKSKLFFFFVLACSFLRAQENQLREFVRVDFPPQTVKLSKTALRALLVEWKHDTLKQYLPVDTNGEYYCIDSLLLTLHGEHWNAPNNYLQTMQANMNVLCRCVSQLKTVNNYAALITNIDVGSWGVYFFFSVNRHNTAVLNGSLYYLKEWNADKAKASKILDELLDNIAYKL